MTSMIDTILDPVEAADYIVSNNGIEERRDILLSEISNAGMRIEDIEDIEFQEALENYNDIII